MTHRTVLALLMLLPLAATATEVRVGVGAWRYDLDGRVTDRGRTYDYQDDLELEPSGRRSMLVEIDTKPGGWPDWAASYSQLGAAGDHEEEVPVFFGGVRVGTSTERIEARADFDDYDLTARWPFALGRFRLAAGITAKRLRGNLLIDDDREDAPIRQRYDEVFPLVHLRARVPLGPHFAFGGAAQGIEYGGSEAYEWRATLEPRWLDPLILEGGWQEKRYRVDVGSYRMDTRLDGAVLRAGLMFD